ncbi:MAG: 4Fe-4S binding protein [Betaproteobacteria bacterium]|nr:4Fe-4S binding protein [Betaproteobacteria bacterium]
MTRAAASLLLGRATLAVLLLFLSMGFVPFSLAGVLTHADLEHRFPEALRILPKDRELPVWPIVKLEGPKETVVAYTFESIDLAPIPGFAGEPFNLLIAIDRHGALLEVRVLAQHEPVFLDGLGPEPLFRFVEQYRGRRILDPWRVIEPRRGTGGVHELGTIDGVSKATASVRIVNETVLAAALQVARAKLGFAAARPAAKVREEHFEPLSWSALRERGLVARYEIAEAQVEQAFAGTGLHDDPVELAPSGADKTELWIAYLNLPSVGRNLLGEAGWRALRDRLEPGQHALLVMASGPRQFVNDAFLRGGVPHQLVLKQGGLPIALRDLDFEVPTLPPDAPKAEAMKVFRIAASAGFDPAATWQLALRVERRQNVMYGETARRDFALEHTLPESYFFISEPAGRPAWRAVWEARRGDLILLGALLVALSCSLAAARVLFTTPRRLAVFRWSFLVLTLGFVGYFAQGQVSIVQVAGIVKALWTGGCCGFLLYDPVTLILLTVALVALVPWGRGAFCGWLCPFGALQEFIAALARRARLPQWHVPALLERRLAMLKYLLLAAILAGAVVAPNWSEALAQSEPFKTAITLGWQSSGGALIYALALLGLGAVVYKAYCRWLCPLGALLAAGDVLRRRDWLGRRAACGKPCQVCRKHCAYGAIADDGAIRYRDCFMCLACVQIFHDRHRCAPLRLAARRGVAVQRSPGRGE